ATMPFAGWPYAEILKEIDANPKIDSRALAQAIADLFMDSFGRQGVALTVLDLAEAGALRGDVGGLARALGAASQKRGLPQQIADAFLDTAHGDVRPLVDVVDLCDKLAEIPESAITKAALALREFTTSGKFVLRHESDPDFVGLHGVGIFAPSVTG